jgi:hypothetical protein
VSVVFFVILTAHFITQASEKPAFELNIFLKLHMGTRDISLRYLLWLTPTDLYSQLRRKISTLNLCAEECV